MPERNFSSVASATSLESAESMASSASACSDEGNAEEPGRLGEGMEKSITARAGSQSKVKSEARERLKEGSMPAKKTVSAAVIQHRNGYSFTPKNHAAAPARIVHN